MIVYKYISFENLVSIIETTKMSLTNIKRWEDPFEGFMPLKKEKDKCIELIMSLYNGNFCDDSTRMELEQKENILYSRVYENFCFAQSWTDSPHESDAMWRIYSGGKGVRIEIDVDEIKAFVAKELINKGFHETDVHNIKIEYSKDTPPLLINNTNHSSSETIFKQIAGYKRRAFIHEDEYRIGFLYPVFDSPEAKKIETECEELRSKNNLSNYLDSLLERFKLLKLESTINFFDYDIELSAIKEIILDPRASDHHTERFFGYMKNRNLNIKHNKSGLYNRG